MKDTILRWLRGEGPHPDAVELAGVESESFSVRPVRMVEPIRLDTTTEQHMELLKAQGATGRNKSDIIRAAIALALPTLTSNPHMIDLLQPGINIDHDILTEAVSSGQPVPERPDNGRGRP